MTKKLWGARFRKKIDRGFFKFQKSIHYDYKLAQYDIYHSLIHVAALKEVGILNEEEEKRLIAGLLELLRDIADNKFKPDLNSEDIHTDIQNKIEKKIGKLSHKLHSLRSRNEQVVFDEKLYCSREAINIASQIRKVISSLESLAKKYKTFYFPGYTHTQRAQVLLFKDYILSFAYMLERDLKRLDNFINSLLVYIGAGALAGTSIPKKAYNEALKKFLGILKNVVKTAQIAKNAVDNVSSRDFIVEFLSILAIIQMHLSRLASDFILYSTKEFDFLDLPQEFCTGSSLMPHKKNPDFLELLRGYTGIIYGNLFSILTLMKGLNLSYNRDMQLDKEPLFSSVEIIREELRLLSEFLERVSLKEESIKRVLEDESLYATEVAEFLVYKGVPFKEAHKIVGKLIRYSEEKKIKIKDTSNSLLKRFHKSLTQEVLRKILSPEYALSLKKSISRAAPRRILRKK